jgi:hypothetical protein
MMNAELLDALIHFRCADYKEVSLSELRQRLKTYYVDSDAIEEEIAERLRKLGYKLRNSRGETYCNLNLRPVVQHAFLLGPPKMKAMLNE